MENQQKSSEWIQMQESAGSKIRMGQGGMGQGQVIVGYGQGGVWLWWGRGGLILHLDEIPCFFVTYKVLCRMSFQKKKEKKGNEKKK